jgi:hypothetical protein
LEEREREDLWWCAGKEFCRALLGQDIGSLNRDGASGFSNSSGLVFGGILLFAGNILAVISTPSAKLNKLREKSF